MINRLKKILEIPALYHYIRQILLLGMPLKKWAFYGNYFNPHERIADLGCGPADILRFLDKKNKPDFYLGIDISDRYLKQARSKALHRNIQSKFITIDLNQLNHDPVVRQTLIQVLTENKISTVNLFGIIHHLDDASVVTTLNTVYATETVTSLNTEDVLTLEHNRVNNFYASLDRGDYVRKEYQYDELIRKSNWKKIDKQWSVAGMYKVRYLHYRLSK